MAIQAIAIKSSSFEEERQNKLHNLLAPYVEKNKGNYSTTLHLIDKIKKIQPLEKDINVNAIYSIYGNVKINNPVFIEHIEDLTEIVDTIHDEFLKESLKKTKEDFFFPYNWISSELRNWEDSIQA